MPQKPATLTSLAIRLGLILALVGVTVVILRLEDEGLVDHVTGKPPSWLSCLYFAMVTITTVGYGDITPVSEGARLVDTFLLVPIRFIVLFTFLGTAYQLVFQRFQEEYRMKSMVKTLREHIIVCGFGAAGRAAVQEMLRRQEPPSRIVVIDTESGALEDAASFNVVAVQGDATRESVLRSVAIDRASHVIINPGRDDTAVLIALTCRDLNPKVVLVASCRQEENARLLQRSGVDVIVSPSTAGGHLMAAATRHGHLVETMQDILSVGGTMKLEEREVLPEEVGQHPASLRDVAVIRVYRDGRNFDVGQFPLLEAGDILVYVALAAPQ